MSMHAQDSHAFGARPGCAGSRVKLTGRTEGCA